MDNKHRTVLSKEEEEAKTREKKERLAAIKKEYSKRNRSKSKRRIFSAKDDQ